MCIDLWLQISLSKISKRIRRKISLDESRQYVTKQYSSCLYNWIKTVPYRLSNDEHVLSISDAGVPVLSIVYSTDPDCISYAFILSSE